MTQEVRNKNDTEEDRMTSTFKPFTSFQRVKTFDTKIVDNIVVSLRRNRM
jgi:hypothetical protein